MSKLRVELNRAACELMRSPEMRAIVEQHARAEQKKAGGDYDVYIAQTRAVAMVFLPPAEAEADNLKNNTLFEGAEVPE